MKPEEIAAEHADWYARNVAKIIKTVYKDAYLHGYKHAKEEGKP